MELAVRLPVIGVVRTSYRELEITPIQASTPEQLCRPESAT